MIKELQKKVEELETFLECAKEELMDAVLDTVCLKRGEIYDCNFVDPRDRSKTPRIAKVQIVAPHAFYITEDGCVHLPRVVVRFEKKNGGMSESTLSVGVGDIRK